ncbi:MAG: rhodanese-like domain-containing protein [Pseudomonadota bacterium]
MSWGPGSGVGAVLPTDAWDLLKTDPNARLIDVRTRAEWGFVGVPDLSELGHDLLLVEWAAWPDMSQNPRFVAEVQEALEGSDPSVLMFLCRSGVRSLSAAEAVGEAGLSGGQVPQLLNVAEGFEGDLDPDNHRGSINGWKARGLAWGQL